MTLIPEMYQQQVEAARQKYHADKTADAHAMAQVAINGTARIEKKQARHEDVMREVKLWEYVTAYRDAMKLLETQNKLIKEMHKRQDEMQERQDKMADFIKQKWGEVK